MSEMNDSLFLRRVSFVLWILTLGAALAFFLAYGYVALSRMDYRFQLEWMEGGALEHVRCLLDGRPLYVEPDFRFVSYIYPPLYFHVSSWVARLTGVEFLAMRIVSFAASIGCFIAIGLTVWKAARSWLVAIVAAGFFAACYEAGGAWLDIGRVDSLFICFLLLGYFVLRSFEGWIAAAVAGALLLISFLAKQSALPIVLCLAPALFLWRGWRPALALSAVFFTGVLASTAWLHLRSDGWYLYYVVELPRSHGVVPEYFRLFWVGDILGRVWPALLFVAAHFIFAFRERLLGVGLLDLAFVVGTFTISCLSRMHYGGFNNVVLPAYAATALMLGLGASELRTWSAAGDEAAAKHPAKIRPLFPGGLTVLLPLLLLIQFRLLTYDPRFYVPGRADRQAGRDLLQWVRQTPGDIFFMRHGYLPALAGEPSTADYIAMFDVMRGPEGETRERFREGFERAVREERFARIVLDPREQLFRDVIENHYTKTGDVFSHPAIFWTRSGQKTRPDAIYAPASGAHE